MSQLGRIGGQVLSDNLLRAGVDLAFETDLLYFNVTTSKIGVRRGVPVYDLDVNSDIRTNNLTVTGQATIDGIVFTAPNTVGSTVAPIDIFINGSTLFHDRLTTSALEFDDNFIGSFANNNIVLDPNGTGTVEIFSTTNITGIVSVTGNIVVPGNLRTDGTLIIGNNSAVDTVTIAPDLTQSLVPGDNILYDLGSALKRWRNGYTNNVDIASGFSAGNITISSLSAISVASGNIFINIAGTTPVAAFTGDIQTSGLKIDGNLIQSFTNQHIVFNPNGSGPIQLEAVSNVTGDLRITGNTVMSGNLSSQGTITIGDQILDTVTINTDFTQSIIPGDTNTYDLGKSNKRWAQVHVPDWTGITTGAWAGSGLYALSATISDQMTLDGVINKISTIQSNEDILLTPDTGITRIESTQWETNSITNLSNNAMVLSSTGRGYVEINGTNGFVMPLGTTLEQRPSPELGETRFNTDLQYIECYDGTVWVVSTGGGEEVTVPIMEDLSNIYVLILG